GNFYLASHKDYNAAISRYKEVLNKYPDYSRLPDTLYNLAWSLAQSGKAEEAATYFARIVSDHPLSDRVSPAKQQLTLLQYPIPETNPVALARAQQTQREAPPGGVLGKLYGVLKPRPSISTDTAAASNAKSEENNESNNEDTG